MTGGKIHAAARRISWFGLILIVFGTLLLLRKLGILDLRVREIVWPLLILVGVVITARGFAAGRRGPIVFGTILFLYSIFFFMRTWGGMFIPYDMILPATFLIFGIVLLMLFLNRPSEWYFLIPGFFLLGIGVMMVLSEYGYWYYWEMRDIVGTWWPVVLILFGLGMLLRRRGLPPPPEAGAGVSREQPAPDGGREADEAGESPSSS